MNKVEKNIYKFGHGSIETDGSAFNKIKPGYDPIITDQKKLRQKSRITTMEEVVKLNLRKDNEHGNKRK